MGAANFDEGGQQGVAFALDLTRRKRAEAEARESERRFREVQAALTHANRGTTVGQLAASIKQLITANATESAVAAHPATKSR